ncbi:ABC transporter permease [Rhizobium sp. KVB221]|uniref:ABC transporter permease n=1 Tax=Rhizobium setariae TaxID=2801340 RepID=A0A936YT02_9HYPH|nr:ABC transporter permease [Rhizobium setariae]MBL0374276.1 ABC transporter permease [Rhizobium setariae]
MEANIVSYVIRRFGFALVTLWVLSLLVFAGSHILPGNVGRAMLGPFADQRAVDALNHEMGADRPLVRQYVDWMAGFVTGDLGKSSAYRMPVAQFLTGALANSAKLAFMGFLMVVPLSILGGVIAAVYRRSAIDKAISIIGISATVVPEFISAILMILVFGIWLQWFPISAVWPAGSGVGTQLYHLFLPSIPLVLVLFGYIARMTRASMIEALDSDYTRTAILKGLSYPLVIWRHCLRNALAPTISVIASQTVYLIGGLVVIELIFRYQGIGSLIYFAAKKKDFPMLQAGVMSVGAIFAVVTLIADLMFAALNPRIRLEGRS